MRRIVAALALLVASTAWAAEPLPQPAHTSVNDFAAVLTDADAQVLDEALIALHGRTGVEGTVVTLPDRARYGDGSLEGFATRLFNAWGVGDADRDDGFLVLLAMAEREVRIELGAGYPASADIRAGEIITRVMVPRLRDGAASAALREGTLALIETVALPQAEGHPRPSERDGGGLAQALLQAAVFGVFAFSGLGVLRAMLRRRREAACPACGARPLARAERPRAEPLTDGATATAREVTRRCSACGSSDSRVLPVPVSVSGAGGRRTERGWRRGGAGRSGGFGGGRSGGGGASGRW